LQMILSSSFISFFSVLYWRMILPPFKYLILLLVATPTL
jgi:hypothetical protein